MLLQDHNRNSSTADRVVVEHVLILVLMEYALRGPFETGKWTLGASLNPCFNGICSASKFNCLT